ncbi:hypothetical protein P280DRAFT_148596 [Massarina eburnea CBS 473.64]|uniref:Uncharacterized protein n=1 Tax=Massarina eburnea CBS 473.64 TaxID=1395130 RepID=A0A6A6RM48_9PLEO|nr:hypothetical protein P280DRAFT_148596 [Massarina eburnea CBS 473.64]
MQSSIARASSCSVQGFPIPNEVFPRRVCCAQKHGLASTWRTASTASQRAPGPRNTSRAAHQTPSSPGRYEREPLSGSSRLSHLLRRPSMRSQAGKIRTARLGCSCSGKSHMLFRRCHLHLTRIEFWVDIAAPSADRASHSKISSMLGSFTGL